MAVLKMCTSKESKPNTGEPDASQYFNFHAAALDKLSPWKTPCKYKDNEYISVQNT
jgi:hypothetical protein